MGEHLPSMPEPQHCSRRSDGTHCPAAPLKKLVGTSWPPGQTFFRVRAQALSTRPYCVPAPFKCCALLPTIHPVKSGTPRLCDTEGVKPSDLFRVHSRLCCAGLEGQVSLKRQNPPAGNRNAVICAATGGPKLA